MTPRNPFLVPRVILLSFSLLLPVAGLAQTTRVSPRVTEQVDETRLTPLRGNTHPLAKAQYDRGAAPSNLPMERMLMVLRRGPDQDAALRQLLDNQQSKASASFHQWLTPQQFGAQFGPADTDIQAVASWLTGHGFTVNRISSGKNVIEFSGTAGQVLEAFHTEIHKYNVNGEDHWANSSDPQIPTALTPVIAGFASLHNFPRKPQNRTLGVFRKNQTTGQVMPLYSYQSPFCQVPVTNSNCNAVGPGDFAVIYGLSNLYAENIDGTGQTIAIVGDSEICTQSTPSFSTCSSDDVKTYRSQFGLSTSNLPTVIVDGPTPGFNTDETEGDLDVQLAGAVARNATIDFVIAQSTESTSGVDLAAEYIVDNNLAPVLSESFGECEAGLMNGGNSFYATLWEQAAAQGISVIISAGDSGSAGCDNPDTQQAAFQFGTGVNGIGSTPFNVVAGGTDFDITQPNYQSTYWSGPNTAASGYVSATQYIPETTWNDSCAQNLSATTGGMLCNSTTTSDPFLNIVGGGGGQSNCSLQNGQGICSGYYAKPSWQPVASGSAGITAANDLSRNLPDISLFSADGFVSDSFHVVCQSDINPNGEACDVAAPYFEFIGVGGTSSAAPAFAGMMALVNQSENKQGLAPRQGNANYVLYNLAANYPASFHDVTRGNNSVPCVAGSFNCSVANASQIYGVLELQDLQTGTQTMNIAFTAEVGADLATGLGSINASNMATNWAKAVGAFTPTTTTLSLATPNGYAPPAACPPPAPPAICIMHGDQVNVTVSVDANGTPIPKSWSQQLPEDVSLIGTGTFSNSTTAGVDQFISNNYVISNADIYNLTNGAVSNAPTTGLVGGSYTVAAHYAGDGTYGVSDSSPGISVTVLPEASTATPSAVLFNALQGTCQVGPNTVLVASLVPFCVPNGVLSQPYGSLFAIRVDVVGSHSNYEKATGNVNLTGLPPGWTATYPLNSEGYVEVQSPGNYGALSGLPQIPALPPGMYSFTAQYCGTVAPCGGDPSYSASPVTSPLAFTVTKGATETSIASSTTTVAQGTPITLTAYVDTENANNYSGGSYGNSPSGMINFMNGAQVIGTPALMPTFDNNGFSAATATYTFTPTTTATYTAQFPGDTNYNSSGSNTGVTVTVTVPPTLNSISPTSGLQGAMVPVTLSGANFTSPATIGFSGSGITVNGTPTVTSSSITATLQISPTALLGPQNVTVTTANGTSSPPPAVTFTVNAPVPTLTAIAPAAAAIGTPVTVTLTGTGFQTGANNTTITPPAGVTVVAGSVNVTSSTSLTAMFTVSSGTGGMVTVTTVGGTSTNNVTFTVGTDFKFAANPTTQTVTRGSSGMTALTLTSTANTAFPAPVTFSVTGLPTETTCTLSTATSQGDCSSFSLAASAGSNGNNTVTLTIGTTAPTLVGPRTWPGSHGPRSVQPLVLLAFAAFLSALLLLVLLRAQGRHPSATGTGAGRPMLAFRYALAALLVMALAGMAAACGGGGGGNSGPPPNPGSAPLGANPITVTAMSANASHQAMYTLTLQ